MLQKMLFENRTAFFMLIEIEKKYSWVKVNSALPKEEVNREYY